VLTLELQLWLCELRSLEQLIGGCVGYGSVFGEGISLHSTCMGNLSLLLP